MPTFARLGILFLSVVLLAATSRRAGAAEEERRGPVVLARRGGGEVVVVPPAGGRAITVVLHGMCGSARHACEAFAAAAEPHGWLVCPAANGACKGGGAIWAGPTAAREEAVEGAVAAVVERFGAAVDARAPRLLVGFSQGAYLAPLLAARAPGRYRGLVLVGAEPRLDIAALRRAGVARVALAAGVYDGARPYLDELGTRLAAQGAPVRFVSLGTVGHTYVPDVPGALEATLAFAAGTE